MMTLEMEPADGRTVDEYAASSAKRFRAKVVPSDAFLGGLKATALVDGRLRDGTPIECLFVPHNNYFYVIGGLADRADAIPLDAMKALGRSIEFRHLANPARYCFLREPSFEILGKFSIKPLTTMRPNPDPPEQGHISICTYNCAARKPDFILDLQVVPCPGRIDLRKVGEKLTAAIGDTEGNWTVFSSDPPCAISATFAANHPRVKGMLTRMGLVQISETEVALLSFVFANREPESLRAYEGSAEAIVRSVKPLAKK
jgi:hypothetical protein